MFFEFGFESNKNGGRLQCVKVAASLSAKVPVKQGNWFALGGSSVVLLAETAIHSHDTQARPCAGMLRPGPGLCRSGPVEA